MYGRLVGPFDALTVDVTGQRLVPGPLSQTNLQKIYTALLTAGLADGNLFTRATPPSRPFPSG